MPHAPSLTRIDRLAALAILGPIRLDDAGARISLPPLEHPRPIVAERLDDPPERRDPS